LGVGLLRAQKTNSCQHQVLYHIIFHNYLLLPFSDS
jgi:hypothetical protein